jgi:hypothetical protein
LVGARHAVWSRFAVFVMVDFVMVKAWAPVSHGVTILVLGVTNNG